MIREYQIKKLAMFDNRTLNLPGEKIIGLMGCDALINAGLYNADRSLCCDVRIDGKWIANDQYTYYGLGWSGTNIPDVVHTNNAAQYDNFISCVDVTPTVKRGRMAIGFTAENHMVILCTPDGAQAMTIPEVHAELDKKACVKRLVLDGGYSPEFITKKEGVLVNSNRNDAYYIGVWIEKEIKHPKICLDPGHGLAEACNQSPDGTYHEYEFALDMANRIRPHLLRCGCEVLLTREDNSTPSLEARAQKANTWGAELYVSLHSNAVPINKTSDPDSDGWSNVTGLSVWTLAAGGERERAAKLLLEQMKAAGVTILGAGLFNANFAVLRRTNMPAYLIEHGFHTTKSDTALLKTDAYRSKLAESTAKAIIAWSGTEWISAVTAPVTAPETKPDSFYTVQFGAFVDEGNAEAMQKTLSAAGYTTIIKEVKK